MKILIETRYTIFGAEGEMFNEVSANVEADCGDVSELDSLINRHMEREGAAERVIRTQLKDLLNGEFEPVDDPMDEVISTNLK